MIRILSKEQAQLGDRIAKKYITKKKLMDNAGKLSAQFFLENIKDPFNQKVLIFAGKGDNGGDAIIMHHYLLEYGIDSKLYIFDVKASNSILKRYKIFKRNIINELSSDCIEKYDWFVDGIFGIGLNRKLTGRYKKIIKMVGNEKIISIDIPSGLDCNKGLPISQNFINPQYVLCMGGYKYANLINEGKRSFEKTYLIDIGLEKAYSEIAEVDTYLIDCKFIKEIIKKDDLLRNKYSNACSIISSSEEYSGAGLLSLSATLSAGSTYVKNLVPGKIIDRYSHIAESVDFAIGNKGYFLESDYSSVIKADIGAKKQPILIGPGLGSKISTRKFTSKILKFLKTKDNACVIDASGFEPIYNTYEIKDLPKNCILTPHLGEAKKIFPQIDFSSPIDASRKIRKIIGNRVLILKGPSTIIITSKGNYYIVNNGNSLLATAGSGDVLSGIILAFLSKGYNIDHASILGVYCHALCSQVYFQKHSRYTMLSRDIIKILPAVLDEVFS